MGQSTTGTNLTTNAAASGRQVCFRALFDWNDKGFSTQASNTAAATWAGSDWCNESAHVVSIRGSMQAVGWQRSVSAVGKGVADVCYVTLRNNSGRFSLAETSGPLYSYIGDGQIRMKRAVIQMGFTDTTNGDELLNQITGYVVGIQPLDHTRQVVLEIRDRAADCVNTRGSTPLYQNYTPAAYMDELLKKMSRDAISTYGSSNNSTGLFPMFYAWAEQEKLWDEIQLVAEAQMGRAFFDKDGDFHFQDAGHWAARWASNSYTEMAFDQGDFYQCLPGYEFHQQYTHVVVSYVPRYLAGNMIVYNASEPLMVAPGDLETLTAEYQYPITSLTSALTASRDYTAVTPGGTDLADDVTVTTDGEGYAGHTTLTCTNAHGTYTCVFCGLSLRGRPLKPYPRMQHEATDGSADHKNTWRVSGNPYIQSRAHAEGVADFILDRYGTPNQTVKLARARGIPWLETGDRIQVNSPNVEQDNNKDAYFITAIDWRWAPRIGYTMDIQGIRGYDLFSGNSGFFVLGSGVYGTDKLFY